MKHMVLPLWILLATVILCGCRTNVPDATREYRPNAVTSDSLVFETMSRGEKDKRWLAWVVRGGEKRLLTEGIVEDGWIETLSPTVVNSGCVISQRPNQLVWRHWGELTVVWNVIVASPRKDVPPDEVEVVFPRSSVITNMDYSLFKSSVSNLAKMVEADYGWSSDSRTACAIWVDLPLAITDLEQSMQSIWELTHNIAVFPYVTHHFRYPWQQDRDANKIPEDTPRKLADPQN